MPKYFLLEVHYHGSDFTEYFVVDSSESIQEIQEKHERYNNKAEEFNNIREAAEQWYGENQYNSQLTEIPDEFKEFILFADKEHYVQHKFEKQYIPTFQWNHESRTHIRYYIQELKKAIYDV